MSISVRNKSNTSFYKRYGRRSSLLCHPIGLELLKHYDQLKKNGLDHELETNLVGDLAKGLEPVIRGKETAISSKMVGVINKGWSQARGGHCTVAGENDESVEGVLSQNSACGNPDVVVRLVIQGEKPNEAQLIIEVSVDGNGEEKKTGQAFDYYASLTKDPCKTVLLFTFHVDGRKQTQNLKITQEAFIYVHNENEKERKVGFLWREIHEKGVGESDLDFLKKSCEGIVRYLECTGTLLNRDTQVVTATTPFPSKWKVASDNAVICGDNEYVLKVFDNRHRPTFLRPDVWLDNDLPWVQDLNVETEFKFTESSDPAVLGRPEAHKCKKLRHDEDDQRHSSHTPYPKGSALVIKYKYQHGTHYASKVSHFRDIAACISKMHSAGIVHGDIRGFNMLHPYPKVAHTKQKESVQKSILIDYDLCGTHGTDVYPPGYSKRVVDNAAERSGKASATMLYMDDWKDLRSVMVCYSVSMENMTTFDEYKKTEKASNEWNTLLDKLLDEGKSSSALHLLEEFIKKIGDTTIEIFKGTKQQMEKLVIKGTGSPGKLQQEPRGSISLHSGT